MLAEQTTRLSYNQIVSTIASNGCVIITIDAPYDVDILEYPDNSLVFINQTVWNNLNVTELAQTAYLAIETRIRDLSFVLDSLSNTTLAHGLGPNLPTSGLSTNHTAMFGYSLGGATAFFILEADVSILGGMNMDSCLFGLGLEEWTSEPFMIMRHAGHLRNSTGEAADPVTLDSNFTSYVFTTHHF